MQANIDFNTRFKRVLAYNRCRIDRALGIFSPKHRPLFFTLPFLLHINHPDFPGFVDDENAPFGLALYSFKQEDQDAVEWFFSEALQGVEIKSLFAKQCAIDSLSLMGSIGTLAQSAKSDLDYWVCVDGKRLGSEKWDLLQQKLTLIEDWAWNEHDLEVHFFLSDIEKVRNCDFGAADGESAGSAQPMFLKNEYYSTTIVVSGRFPFWWLSSYDCSDERYQREYALFKKLGSPKPQYVMDLGNVANLHANEMFGAMIWQLTKAMDSPFKSVLKMAKLEVFSDNTENRTALCNVLKKRIHQGGDFSKDVRRTDPYTIMFDTIVDYYQANFPKFVDLFNACLYIKSGTNLSNKGSVSKSLKRQVIVEYLREWGWTGQKVEHFDGIKDWSYQQVEFLGKVIHSFLIGCYRRVSKSIAGKAQLVTDEDMTVIGRKISSFYGAKDGKIQYLKRAFESGLVQMDITITVQLDLNSSTKQSWSAFRGRVHMQDADSKNSCFLKESVDPVDLVMWCIFNQIITTESNFYLLQSKLPISLEDITELMDEVLLDCQPIKISELPRELLLNPCQITHCLVVINFSSRSTVYDVEGIRVVYLTSWGELFSFAGLHAFVKVKQACEEQIEPPVCRLFTPSRNNRKVLYRKLEALADFSFDKVGLAPEPVPEEDEQSEVAQK